MSGGLDTAIGYAVQGLHTQSERLAITADNIANAATPGYQRIDPSAAVSTGSDAAPPLGTYNAQGVVAQGGTPSALPTQGSNNVDLTQEIVDLGLASTAYQASAKVLAAASKLEKSFIQSI